MTVVLKQERPIRIKNFNRIGVGPRIGAYRTIVETCSCVLSAMEYYSKSTFGTSQLLVVNRTIIEIRHIIVSNVEDTS